MQVRTACNRDCPDACGMIATVEEGRITRLRGDREHPVTRGFLCARTSRFLERQYDPERLTTPLVRRGGALEPASWDEALDLIAAAMLRIRAESGGAAILHYRSGGSLGLMKHVTDRFFELFGPTAMKTGDICSGAGDAAQMADFGHEDSHDLFDLRHSRGLILWGKNPHAANVHLLPLLQDARRRGARLVLVDPVKHRGAELCQRHVQLRPGGDAALALAVARLLFERGAVPEDVATWGDHVEDLRRQALSRTTEEWCRVADVTADAAEALADVLADRPAAILVGWGMGRRRHGSATVRLVDALSALSGNVGIPGGGSSFYFKRRGAFDLSFVRGESAAPRLVPEALLGREILAAKDPPIRMTWVTAGNPVVMLPESRTVEQALSSRELTVVVDAFLTDTALCAHVVLPTTTMLEDDDLVGAYGHHWLGEVRPVVPPPAGVRTDYEIVQALAPRVGLGEAFAEPVEAWKRRLLGRVASRGAALEDLRQGWVRNPLAPEVLFADRKFETPTRRMNFVHDVDPTPPAPTTLRPLLLMAQSTDRAQCSQWSSAEQVGPAEAVVHPDAAPGFRDGDLALVESDLDAIEVRLVFDPRQRQDVLLMEKGGWLKAGRAANTLIRAEETDGGRGAVYLDTPVRLLPASAVRT